MHCDIRRLPDRKLNTETIRWFTVKYFYIYSMKEKISEEYFLGVDIGTGSTKAVALNKEGKPFEEAQFFYPTTSVQAGYSEQDPELIWEAFINCIREIITKTNRVPIAVSHSG